MAKEPMKTCPLLGAGHYAGPPGSANRTSCLRGRCAWWDDAQCECSVLSLAIAAKHIAHAAIIFSDSLPDTKGTAE